MGTQTKFGTAGATGGGWSAQPGTLQAAFSDLLPGLPANDWQRIAPKTWRDRNKWVSLWPVMGSGCFGGGDGMGADATVASWTQFEPFSCDGDGTQSKNAIRGTVKDSVGTAVANAIVQGFVTASDAYVGEVQSGLDGTYTLPTEQLKTTPHYLVAYKAGSPDTAGTTVNTLLPTNIDGT